MKPYKLFPKPWKVVGGNPVRIVARNNATVMRMPPTGEVAGHGSKFFGAWEEMLHVAQDVVAAVNGKGGGNQV